MKPYIVLVLAASAPHAAAQQLTAPPNPADADAPVPVVKFESAFASYRSYREEPLAPWREVNDEAARVGGAGGHAGNAVPMPTVKPRAAASVPPASAAPPRMHERDQKGMEK